MPPPLMQKAVASYRLTSRTRAAASTFGSSPSRRLTSNTRLGCFHQACRLRLQLLKSGDGPLLVVRAVAGDEADELLADRGRRHPAEADARVAQGAGDLRAEPGLVAAFDPHRMDVIGLAHARLLRGVERFFPFQRSDEYDALARLLGAPRQQHLEVGARLRQGFQLVRGASRPVVDRDRPYIGLADLQCHDSLLPVWLSGI